MNQLRRFDTDGCEQRREQFGEGWLANPAQSQRSQGNTQLAGGKVSVHLVMHSAQDTAAPAMRLGQTVDLGGTQANDGELGGDEETVEQNQKKGEQHETDIGPEGGGGKTRGRIHERESWPMTG